MFSLSRRARPNHCSECREKENCYFLRPLLHHSRSSSRSCIGCYQRLLLFPQRYIIFSNIHQCCRRAKGKQVQVYRASIINCSLKAEEFSFENYFFFSIPFCAEQRERVHTQGETREGTRPLEKAIRGDRVNCFARPRKGQWYDFSWFLFCRTQDRDLEVSPKTHSKILYLSWWLISNTANDRTCTRATPWTAVKVLNCSKLSMLIWNWNYWPVCVCANVQVLNALFRARELITGLECNEIKMQSKLMIKVHIRSAIPAIRLHD